MVIPVTELTLLDEIIDRLEALPDVQVIRRQRGLATRSGQRSDVLIDLATPTGNHTYVVETKLKVTTSTLEAVIAQVQRAPRPGDARLLLATRYLPDSLIEPLVDTGIDFVDTAGNMVLRAPGLYVMIRGRKPVGASVPDAFTATGLKVVYALLAYPELREGTYRELKDATGVGLGSVSRTVNDLLEQGYLLKGKQGTLYPAQFGDLLTRWELGYLETLRPKLAPSAWRYTSRDRREALKTLCHRSDVLIGGEEAAARLTRYLKPQTLTLHAERMAQKKLCAALRLLPTKEAADVYLLNLPLPYDLARAGDDRLASPILVRAELLAYGGDRLREVASRLLDAVEPALQ